MSHQSWSMPRNFLRQLMSALPSMHARTVKITSHPHLLICELWKQRGPRELAANKHCNHRSCAMNCTFNKHCRSKKKKLDNYTTVYLDPWPSDWALVTLDFSCILLLNFSFSFFIVCIWLDRYHQWNCVCSRLDSSDGVLGLLHFGYQFGMILDWLVHRDCI